MRFAFLGLTLTLIFLYAHVSNNIEKYSESGNVVARAIVLVAGLIFGTFSAFLFLKNVAEPSWAFGSGFLVGPLLAIVACIYLVVAIFFPLQHVQGLLRYSFSSNSLTIFEAATRSVIAELPGTASTQPHRRRPDSIVEEDLLDR